MKALTYPRMLRKLKAEYGQLKRDFKRFAQHEDSCGIYDERKVCSCGMTRVLERIEK